MTLTWRPHCHACVMQLYVCFGASCILSCCDAFNWSSLRCCTLLLPCCRGGERSTSSEVLQALATQHPLPGLILQHRKLHKLKTGFMNSLGAKLAQLQQQQQRAAAASGAGCLSAADGTPAGPCALLDGECTIEPHNDSSSSGLVRIRGSFLQTNTATGRLSMDDPALQTMPRPLDFTLEGAPPTAAAAANRSSSSFSDDDLPAGASVSGVVPQQVQVNVRAAFVAPPGWVLLSADYSQIELRLVSPVGGGGGVPLQ